MSERLSYGLLPHNGINPRLSVVVPTAIWGKLKKDTEQSAAIRTLGSNNNNIIAIAEDTHSTLMTINDKRIGNSGKKQIFLSRLLGLMAAIEATADDDQKDSRISFKLESTGTGYELEAAIAWPKCELDPRLEGAATTQMRSMAAKLKYDDSEAPISALVYTSVWRVGGVLLQAHALANSSLQTDVTEYSATEPVFRLRSYNLSTPERPLVCIAGAVALACFD